MMIRTVIVAATLAMGASFAPMIVGVPGGAIADPDHDGVGISVEIEAPESTPEPSTAPDQGLAVTGTEFPIAFAAAGATLAVGGAILVLRMRWRRSRRSPVEGAS